MNKKIQTSFKKEIGLNIILFVTLICSLFLSTQLIQVSASVGASTFLTPPNTHSDIYVFERNPVTYYNYGPTYVGRNSNYQLWTCLYWDLSTISGTISVADVRITCQNMVGNPFQMGLYRITSDWMPLSGGTPTWNTKPSYDPNAMDTFTVLPGTHTDNLISTTAEYWRTGALPNYGIYLIAIGESLHNYVYIGSLDSGPPVYLDITYSIPEFNGGMHLVIFSLLAAAIFTIGSIRKRFRNLKKF